jgi:integrase
MKATGRPGTVHGLRSAFRDWCADGGVASEIAEMALAHQVGSAVERAYRHSDLFARRRELMARWAEHCSDAPGRVVRLQSAR